MERTFDAVRGTALLNDSHTDSRQKLTDIAALWYAQLDSGTADVKAFEAWRDADSRHAVAFAWIIRAANLLDELKDMGSGGNGEKLEREHD